MNSLAESGETLLMRSTAAWSCTDSAPVPVLDRSSIREPGSVVVRPGASAVAFVTSSVFRASSVEGTAPAEVMTGISGRYLGFDGLAVLHDGLDGVGGLAGADDRRDHEAREILQVLRLRARDSRVRGDLRCDGLLGRNAVVRE